MQNNISDILSTIQTYLDGLYQCDVSKLRSAFHERSYLYSVTDGTLNELAFEDWCSMVEKRESPAKQGFTRELERILRIEESAPNCANITLNCAVPGRLFTDHLSLIKTSQGWKIVNKVFHAQPIGA